MQGRFALGELGVEHVPALSQERLPVVLEDNGRTQSRTRCADAMKHRAVVRLTETSSHQQEAHTGLVKRVLELGRLIRGVDRDQDRPNPRGRELNNNPFVAIRRPDADAVALTDAVGDQCPRGEVDLVPQLAVGGSLALVANNQRLPIPEAVPRTAEILAERLVEEPGGGWSALICKTPAILALIDVNAVGPGNNN